MKSIIIGGVPRAGKSTLARMLKAKLGFSHIPTDALVSAFQRTYPDLKITHKNDILKTWVLFTPFMNEALISLAWILEGFGVEGAHLHPEYFSQQVKDTYHIVFIWYPTLNADEKLSEIRKRDEGKKERTNKVDDETLHRSLTERIANSRDIQKMCQEQGFTFIDTSEDQDGAIAKAFDEISAIL